MGKATVVAYLPALNDEVKQEIEIKEGENLVDLELGFDLARWKERKEKKAGAPPTGSATGAKPADAPPK